jgi:hypothetical protein
MANVFSYDSNARKESLLDIITNISPVENGLIKLLGRSSATNTLHEWVTDTLKTPAAQSVVEGSDASFANRTNPTRVQNQTQIVRIDFAVTDTERARNYPGFKDRYAYEMQKAMKEWSNDAEFNLLRSTIATGTGSAARTMVGLKASITTNATAQSGVSLTEAQVNDYMQSAWNAGGEPTDILVGSRLKRRISTFTANTTRQSQSESEELHNVVDTYYSDFGVFRIRLHRFMTVSGDTNFDILGVQPDKFRVAYLREPEHVTLSKTGSATKGMIEGEMTLEYLAESSSFKATAQL